MNKRIGLPVRLRLAGGLDARTVEATISTPQQARDGDVWMPAGVQLSNYRRNPIVCFNHDPAQPVGTATVSATAQSVTAVITFAPAGTSERADEICGLVKTGVLSGISCGMMPLESEWIDPRNPGEGRRFTSWELLEISIVSIPADTGAGVTARAYGGRSEYRRRQREAAARSCGVPVTYAERQADLARLAPATMMPPPPVFDGSAARFCHDMRNHLQHRTLTVSASPKDTGATYFDRQAEVARLRRAG